MKNLGATAEIEAIVMEDGSGIDLTLTYSQSELDGFGRWLSPVDIDGRKVYQDSPAFESQRTMTNLRVTNGARTLVSFRRLRPALVEAGRAYEIVTLRVTAHDLLAQ